MFDMIHDDFFEKNPYGGKLCNHYFLLDSEVILCHCAFCWCLQKTNHVNVLFCEIYWLKTLRGQTISRPNHRFPHVLCRLARCFPGIGGISTNGMVEGLVVVNRRPYKASYHFFLRSEKKNVLFFLNFLAKLTSEL